MRTNLTTIAMQTRQRLRGHWRHWNGRWATVRGDVAAGVAQGAVIGALVVLVAAPFIAHRSRPQAAAPQQPQAAVLRGAAPIEGAIVVRQADFGNSLASDDARTVANWVARTGDNGGRPFAILDKRGARLFVFEPGARLVGTSLVLLGSAQGDESTPGIGDKPLSLIEAHERTTPAGRFVSEPGHDSTGENVVWVDYDGAVAMHRVRVVDPKERRFERIATTRIDDKRISNGCINVPVEFFDGIVEPWLMRSAAVVYILPEVKALHDVFSLRGAGAVAPTAQQMRTIPRRVSGLT